MLGERRIVVALGPQETAHFALVLLEETLAVVLRVPLEIDEPEAVRAGRDQHPALVARDQHLEARRLHLPAGDVVEPRVGRLEAGVDPGDERVGAVGHAVGEDAPALGRQVGALHAVEPLERGVARKARAEHGGHVLPPPVEDLDERLPERLAGDVGLGDVGAGHDEGVEPVALELVERLVEPLHPFASGSPALHPGHREGVHEELGDPVGGADEAQELAFGRGEGRVRHQVEETDVELADVLSHRPPRIEDLVSLAPEPVEGRKVGMGDEGHRARDGTGRGGDRGGGGRRCAGRGVEPWTVDWPERGGGIGAKRMYGAAARGQTPRRRAGASAASRISPTRSRKSASSRTASATLASTV